VQILQTLAVSDLYRLLGKNIAHFRRQAGLTQEQLAERTDYSVDFIGLVERGVNAPTVARLADIARVLGVELWRLFYSEHDTQPNRRPTAKGGKAAKKPTRH
jgi:transcriptional regulator with XRE-family HTH domain